jgi:hypothetical protein
VARAVAWVMVVVAAKGGWCIAVAVAVTMAAVAMAAVAIAAVAAAVVAACSHHREKVGGGAVALALLSILHLVCFAWLALLGFLQLAGIGFRPLTCWLALRACCPR